MAAAPTCDDGGTPREAKAAAFGVEIDDVRYDHHEEESSEDGAHDASRVLQGTRDPRESSVSW